MFKPPAFIIHHSNSSERAELVKDLQRKTGAILVEAIMLPDGLEGNKESHLAVARLAKSLHPDKHYLVFEDDCVLSEEWNKAIEGMQIADVLYLGYSDKCEHTTFGTHALLMGPKGRDALLHRANIVCHQVLRKQAMDHILSRICREEGLLVAMPPFVAREYFAYQKKGIKSLITGQIRD